MRRKPHAPAGEEHRRSKPKPILRDRCGATGKLRYRTRSAARSALQSTRSAREHEMDHRRRETRIYPCVKCAGFHLTGQPWVAPDARVPLIVPGITTLPEMAVIHDSPESGGE